MAPLALAAAWAGGLVFAILVAVGSAVMCWEWHGMVDGRLGRAGGLGAAVCSVASVLALFHPALAVGLVALGALAGWIVAGGVFRHRLWALTGILYVGLLCLALVWLRGDTVSGRFLLIWLLLAVWATDTGAYMFGRLIGGPLLLPAVSPKKTWAGLLGGMLCSGAAGFGMSGVMEADPVILAGVSGTLAVVAQGGDLWESWVKRRWNVKDASNLIPGHGGVLDRVDGLLAAAGAAALVLLTAGTDFLKGSW